MIKKILKKDILEDLIKEGGDLLSHIIAVPSALMDLTSLFGMVRGEPHCNNHLKLYVLL